jgi:hypothetical protein
VTFIEISHLRQHFQNQQDEASEDSLSNFRFFSFDINPEVHQCFTLMFENLKHCAVNKPCQDRAHQFVGTLEEALLEYLSVRELNEEPLCPPPIEIHIGLEVLDHGWQMGFIFGSLHYGDVVRCSELKHTELHVLDLFLRVHLSHIE